MSDADTSPEARSLPLSLFDVVNVSIAVGATSKRTEKRTILAELLGRSSPEEIPIVVGFLTGEVRQGRIGVGWATLRDVDVEHAGAPWVSVLAVDEAIAEVAMTTGPGSMAERDRLLGKLFGSITSPESEFLTATPLFWPWFKARVRWLKCGWKFCGRFNQCWHRPQPMWPRRCKRGLAWLTRPASSPRMVARAVWCRGSSTSCL